MIAEFYTNVRKDLKNDSLDQMPSIWIPDLHGS